MNETEQANAPEQPVKPDGCDPAHEPTAKNSLDAAKEKARATAEALKSHDFKGDARKAAEGVKNLKDELKKHDFKAEFREAFSEAKKSPKSIWKKPETLRPGKELAVVGFSASVAIFLFLSVTSSSFLGFLCLLLSAGALLFSLLGLKTEGRNLAIGGSAVSLLAILCALGQTFGSGGGMDDDGEDMADGAALANGQEDDALTISEENSNHPSKAAIPKDDGPVPVLGEYDEYEGEEYGSAEDILAAAQEAKKYKSMDFCGFYTGMSMKNAKFLAKHYGFDDDDAMFRFHPKTGEVHQIRFSPRAISLMLDVSNDFDLTEAAIMSYLGIVKWTTPMKGNDDDSLGGCYITVDGISVELNKLDWHLGNCSTLTITDPNRKAAYDRIAGPFYNNKLVAEKKAELEKYGMHPRVVRLSGGIDLLLSSFFDGMKNIGINEPQENARKTFITSFEFTEAQWEAVMGRQPSRSAGPTYPVKWGEIGLDGDFMQYPHLAFLDILNSMSYAQKMGFYFMYPSSGILNIKKRIDGVSITSDNLDSVAWYGGNSQNAPHPVASLMPNAFGLYDVFGNMSELVDEGEVFMRFGGDYYDTAKTILAKSPVENLDVKRKGFSRQDMTLRFIAVETDMEHPRGIELPGGVLLPMRVIGKDESVWWSIFEITRAQWKSVMGTVPGIDSEETADAIVGLVAIGSGREDAIQDKSRHPVVNVSWNDCRRFLQKLNELQATKDAGVVFDLPTAEEWVNVCLAGSVGKYGRMAGGTEIDEHNLGSVAWFQRADDKPRQAGDEFLKKLAHASPHEVGWKSPNDFGLYDMLGNVAEWTSSVSGTGRIVCGGKGDGYPSVLDCSAKGHHSRDPDESAPFLGLRVVARKVKLAE